MKNNQLRILETSFSHYFLCGHAKVLSDLAMLDKGLFGLKFAPTLDFFRPTIQSSMHEFEPSILKRCEVDFLWFFKKKKKCDPNHCHCCLKFFFGNKILTFNKITEII